MNLINKILIRFKSKVNKTIQALNLLSETIKIYQIFLRIK